MRRYSRISLEEIDAAILEYVRQQGCCPRLTSGDASPCGLNYQWASLDGICQGPREIPEPARRTGRSVPWHRYSLELGRHAPAEIRPVPHASLRQAPEDQLGISPRPRPPSMVATTLETAHLPASIAEMAENVFSEQLRRHGRRFGGAIYLVADLAKDLFLSWVCRHHAHPAFASRFPVEGGETARYYLLITDLAFRKTSTKHRGT